MATTKTRRNVEKSRGNYTSSNTLSISSLFFRKYEKTPDIEHGDLVFYRFQQKIRYAPDQIIRWVLFSFVNTNNISLVQLRLVWPTVDIDQDWE